MGVRDFNVKQCRSFTPSSRMIKLVLAFALFVAAAQASFYDEGYGDDYGYGGYGYGSYGYDDHYGYGPGYGGGYGHGVGHYGPRRYGYGGPRGYGRHFGGHRYGGYGGYGHHGPRHSH